MKNFIWILAIIPLLLISCGGNSKSSEQEEQRSNVYIVNHPDDVGKYGEGTYLNSNSEYTCPHCGLRVSRNNIFHDCQKPKTYSGGNQYGEGYEQGQEDARNGLDPDPEGYGGNGQFEKGYEDGYEDW